MLFVVVLHQVALRLCKRGGQVVVRIVMMIMRRIEADLRVERKGEGNRLDRVAILRMNLHLSDGLIKINRQLGSSLCFWCVAVAFFCEIFFVQFVSAQYEVEDSEDSVRLISPYGAVARSAVIPGWGQYHARNYLQSVFSFSGVCASLAGVAMTHFSFREIYDKEYLPLAVKNRKSKAALIAYDRANQKYRVRQFLLYSAAGIWAYSIIDSYVAANLYNALTKSRLIIEESKAFEEFSFKFDLNQDYIVCNLVGQF